jgi:hypothetical protein
MDVPGARWNSATSYDRDRKWIHKAEDESRKHTRDPFENFPPQHNMKESHNDVKTDYDRSYMGAIDKSHPLYKERLAVAERKAKEIEELATSDPYHMDELTVPKPTTFSRQYAHPMSMPAEKRSGDSVVRRSIREASHASYLPSNYENDTQRPREKSHSAPMPLSSPIYGHIKVPIDAMARQLSIHEPPDLSNEHILHCEFRFLGCRSTFSSLSTEEWIAHSIAHFGHHGPPEWSSCTICGDLFQSAEPDFLSRRENWWTRMNHIAHHLKVDFINPSSNFQADPQVLGYMKQNSIAVSTQIDLKGSNDYPNDKEEAPTNSLRADNNLPICDICQDCGYTHSSGDASEVCFCQSLGSSSSLYHNLTQPPHSDTLQNYPISINDNTHRSTTPVGPHQTIRRDNRNFPLKHNQHYTANDNIRWEDMPSLVEREGTVPQDVSTSSPRSVIDGKSPNLESDTVRQQEVVPGYFSQSQPRSKDSSAANSWSRKGSPHRAPKEVNSATVDTYGTTSRTESTRIMKEILPKNVQKRPQTRLTRSFIGEFSKSLLGNKGIADRYPAMLAISKDGSLYDEFSTLLSSTCEESIGRDSHVVWRVASLLCLEIVSKIEKLSGSVTGDGNLSKIERKPLYETAPIDRIHAAESMPSDKDVEFALKIISHPRFWKSSKHVLKFIAGVKQIYHDGNEKMIQIENLVTIHVIEGNDKPVNICLEMDWNLPKFMHTQYDANMCPKIGSVIAITGSALYCQATTCREYLHDHWPEEAPIVLQHLQDALDSKTHNAAGKSTSTFDKSWYSQKPVFSSLTTKYKLKHPNAVLLSI